MITFPSTFNHIGGVSLLDGSIYLQSTTQSAHRAAQVHHVHNGNDHSIGYIANRLSIDQEEDWIHQEINRIDNRYECLASSSLNVLSYLNCRKYIIGINNDNSNSNNGNNTGANKNGIGLRLNSNIGNGRFHHDNEDEEEISTTREEEEEEEEEQEIEEEEERRSSSFYNGDDQVQDQIEDMDGDDSSSNYLGDNNDLIRRYNQDQSINDMDESSISFQHSSNNHSTSQTTLNSLSNALGYDIMNDGDEFDDDNIVVDMSGDDMDGGDITNSTSYRQLLILEQHQLLQQHQLLHKQNMLFQQQLEQLDNDNEYSIGDMDTSENGISDHQHSIENLNNTNNTSGLNSSNSKVSTIQMNDGDGMTSSMSFNASMDMSIVSMNQSIISNTSIHHDYNIHHHNIIDDNDSFNQSRDNYNNSSRDNDQSDMDMSM